MTYKLYFTSSGESYNDYIINLNDYEYTVEPNLSDITEYYFEKTFRKPYDSLKWYLEPGARELVREVETKWFKNEIDTITLYRDYDFVDWLKDKYYLSALNKASLEEIDETEDIIDCYYNM